MPLINTQVEAAKPQLKPYRLNDGGGLQLEIRPSGVKVWMYRYRKPATHKPSIYTLGEYPVMGIRQARAELLEVKMLLKQGIDPNLRKQQNRVQLEGERFKDVALEWYENKLGRWSTANAKQVKACLEMDVFPFIGMRELERLEVPDLLQVIRRAEGRGALDKAQKVKQRLGAIYRYAVATGRVKYNPVPDMGGALRTRGRKHYNALAADELPGFLGCLAAYPSEVMRRAVEFTLLTFVRTGSIRQAEWSEIDWEGKAWLIPAHHMKMKEAHLVPLSAQALRLLEELRPFTSDSHLIFYTVRPESPLSENAMLQVLRRIGWSDRTTIHGFRALASSVLHDAGFEPKVIEKQLAHAERNKVAGAYNYMAQYLPERVRLMQWWGDYLEAKKSGRGDVLLGRFGRVG